MACPGWRLAPWVRRDRATARLVRGARPLKRALQKRVQNLLADRILAGELGAGDVAEVDFAVGAFRQTRRSSEPELAGTAS